LRAHSHDRHRQVDDTPFGGGPGMVMKPEPVIEAVEAIRATNRGPVILMEPWGARLDQKVATQLATEPGLIIVCGRYEGIDDRVRTALQAGDHGRIRQWRRQQAAERRDLSEMKHPREVRKS